MESFDIGDHVVLLLNKKPCTIEGVCRYSKNPTQYLVEYVNGIGDIESKWVNSQDIKKA